MRWDELVLARSRCSPHAGSRELERALAQRKREHALLSTNQEREDSGPWQFLIIRMTASAAVMARAEKRSGGEAGIPTTPGGWTLAALRPVTKLSSCQRGPIATRIPFGVALQRNW